MFLIVFLLNAKIILGATQADVKALIEDVFTNETCLRIVRGELDMEQTTLVDMSFALRSINRFDEAGENLDVMGMAMVTWSDKRLTWDPTKYNNTNKIQVSKDMVWTPTILLANPAEASSCSENDPLVTVDSNGNVLYAKIDVFQVKCSAVVTAFPFDHQSCGIMFSIDGYTKREVDLISTMNKMITDQFLDNGIWDLKETSVVKPNFSFSSMLEFRLTVERKEAFFVVNLLIPSLILGFLGLLVFLIPIESGERISYCITILLTVGIFLNLVSDYLPANSVKMASICFLLLCLFIECTLICLCSILSVRMYHQELTAFERWIILYTARICKQRKQKCNQDTNIEILGENEAPNGPNEDKVDKATHTKGEFKKIDEEFQRTDKMEQPSIWKNYSKNFDCFCFVLFFLQNVIVMIFYLSSVHVVHK